MFSKPKRVISLILLLAVLAGLCLFAADIDELYQKVLTTAPAILELQEQRRTELINELVSKSGSGFKWSLGFSDFSYTPMKGEIKAPSTEVSFSSPESENNFSYEGKLSTAGFVVQPEVENTSVSLRAGFSKGFAFKSWDSTDYTSALTIEKTINEFSILLLNFENRFLNDVITIITKERERAKLSSDFIVYSFELDDDVEAGRIKVDSPEYKKRAMEKQLKEVELDKIDEELDARKKDFKETYGTEYIEIDTCTELEPTFDPDINDSFSVQVAQARLKEVEQKIAEKTGTSSKLTITGGVEPTVYFQQAKAYEHMAVRMDLGAALEIGNFSLSATIGSEYNTDPSSDNPGWGYGPVISISGSWSNTPSALSAADDAKLRAIYSDDINTYEKIIDLVNDGSSRKQELEIYQLQKDLSEAQKELFAAMDSYLEKSVDLMTELNAFKTSSALLNVKLKSQKELRDQMSELFISGELDDESLYISEDLEYEGLLLEKLISNLQARILWNKIDMIRLY